MGYESSKKTTAFVSGLGKHNLHSLGKDLGLDEFLKHANNMKNAKIDPKSFEKGSEAIIRADSLLDLGVRAGTGVIAKVIENGINSLANKDKPN
jgi:hypothetical protein